ADHQHDSRADQKVLPHQDLRSVPGSRSWAMPATRAVQRHVRATRSPAKDSGMVGCILERYADRNSAAEEKYAPPRSTRLTDGSHGRGSALSSIGVSPFALG